MAGLAGKLIKIVFVKDKTTKYIELKKFSNGSDFMFEDILQSVQLETEDKAFEYFTDSTDVKLPPEIVLKLCYQFIYCTTFILKYYTTDCYTNNEAIINVNSDANSISVEELKDFISKNDGDLLLKKAKSTLTDTDRRLLVRLLAHFITSKFGDHPCKEVKLRAAILATDLFPSFKSDTKYKGAEIFFNPENNSGYLNTQIKNRNFKRKKFNSEDEESKENTPIIKLSEEDLNFFKTVQLPHQKDQLIEKLKKTADLRQKLVKRDKNIKTTDKINTIFSFYYIDPELILIDFKLLIPQVTTNFNEAWLHIEQYIPIVLQSKGLQTTSNFQGWSKPIQYFLDLIKLLPSPTGTRVKTTSCSHEKMVYKFIKYFHSNILKKKMIFQNQLSSQLDHLN